MSMGRESMGGGLGGGLSSTSIELHESKSRGIFLTGGDTLRTWELVGASAGTRPAASSDVFSDLKSASRSMDS